MKLIATRFRSENVENEVFAFVEAARRRVVVLPSRIEGLKTHRRRLGRVAEVVLVITVGVVHEARPVLEFAGRSRVGGRFDDVADVQTVLETIAVAIRTLGHAGANPGDATAKIDVRADPDGVSSGNTTAETETGSDDAFAFFANVGRLTLSRRLSRGRNDRVLSADGRNEGKRGGDQKSRENVAFHLFLLEIRGFAASDKTAAIRKTRRSRRRDDVGGGRNVVAFGRDTGVGKTPKPPNYFKSVRFALELSDFFFS